MAKRLACWVTLTLLLSFSLGCVTPGADCRPDGVWPIRKVWSRGLSLKILLDSPDFYGTYWSQTAQPICGVVAWLRVRESRSAVEDFTYVFKNSRSSAGRLYALAGIFELDPEAYRRLRSEVNGGERVQVIESDSIGPPVPVGHVLSEIESGSLQARWRDRRR